MSRDITYQVYQPDKTRIDRKYYDENGAVCTHIDYFKSRIRDIADACGSTYDEEDYADDSNQQATMSCVLNMAEKIRRYADSLPAGMRVVLHADSTGGPRSANMVIMALLRLMQYSGMEIGRILYSNYNLGVVEESGYIYDLFDMVSGAEEFANFGSANTINKYFARCEKTPALENLLQAMKRFSEEIRLCHRKQLEEAAQNLRNCLIDFREENAKDMSSSLMHQLESRLMRDYEPILQADQLDILNLISWCLDHDYLQQALTLYVEGIPDFLYEKGVFGFADEEKKADILKGKGEELSEGFYFLTAFAGGKDYTAVKEAVRRITNCRNSLFGIYKKYTENILKGTMTANEAVEAVIQHVAAAANSELTNVGSLEEMFCALEKWKDNPALLKGNPYDLAARKMEQIIPKWQEKPFGIRNC